MIRNYSTPDSRAFWASVKKSADSVRGLPAWQQAGIELNEESFETYSPAKK